MITGAPGLMSIMIINTVNILDLAETAAPVKAFCTV
jgi:hypothetical protein